jgi:HTH-type transcriptional regulator/antitoxin HigA
MDVRPLHTPEDHAWALQEIQRLWNLAKPGTPEGDRFEVLSILVDEYEKKTVKMPETDPVDAILFRIDQEGLAPKDLLDVFKTRARVSEILARKRRLSTEMIRALHARFGIPFDVLLRPYSLARKKSKKRGPHRRKAA